MAIGTDYKNYDQYNLNNQWGFNVGKVGQPQVQTGGEAAGYESLNTGKSPRAVDNLPKAQMVNYREDLPSQAGYERGISEWSLMA